MRTAEGTAWGRWVFGLGVIALAGVCLWWRDFDPGQPVPRSLPDRAALAAAAAAFMLAAGAGVLWRRTAAWSAPALAACYAMVVVALMNGRVVLAHPAQFGAYSGSAEQLALAAGALIIWAGQADLSPALAARLSRLGRAVFGLCALLFGAAHFVYLNLTAPLVPRWLPPGQDFWAFATGAAHVAAGLALLSGIQARLAAILLTVMFAAFTPLVHLPMLLADPSSRWIWSENALNLALTGVAWAAADSLARGRGAGVSPSGPAT